MLEVASLGVKTKSGKKSKDALFLQKGQNFKDKSSFLTVNLFNGQKTLNLVRDNKDGQIRKPRARTHPTLRMSVVKLVPSPSEHSHFLDMTIAAAALGELTGLSFQKRGYKF